MKTAIAIMLVLFASSLPNPAFAGSERTLVPAEKASLITSPSGESRILIGFEDVYRLQDHFISSATLIIPLPGELAAAQIDLELAPITRSWSRGATWESPWTTPGGDRNAEYSTDLSVAKGGRGAELRIDLTDIVRGTLEGETSFYGVLLMPVEGTGKLGFDDAERAFLGTMGDARMEIVHRKVSRRRG